MIKEVFFAVNLQRPDMRMETSTLEEAKELAKRMTKIGPWIWGTMTILKLNN